MKLVLSFVAAIAAMLGFVAPAAAQFDGRCAPGVNWCAAGGTAAGAGAGAVAGRMVFGEKGQKLGALVGAVGGYYASTAASRAEPQAAPQQPVARAPQAQVAARPQIEAEIWEPVGNDGKKHTGYRWSNSTCTHLNGVARECPK